jgi:hypothetical protein
MLFQDGIFNPGGAGDARVRAALAAAAGRPQAVLGVSGLLAGVVRHGGDGVAEALGQALPPGRPLGELLASLEGAPAPAGSPAAPAPRTRDSFTPAALEALDSFEAELARAGGTLDGVGAEVLLLCLLPRAGDEGRGEALTGLDLERAVGLLFRRVVGGLDLRPLVEKVFSGAPGGGEDGPGGEGERFPLPPEAGAAEDLTRMAREAAGEGPFPFDGEAPFERLFEDLTRALHRRQARHVLLAGERGVAKGTLVAELARRAAAGAIPSLRDRHFLRADCRSLAAAEGGGLHALLGAVGDRPELVLVLDGLGALLHAGGAEGFRALLAALPRLHCRLVILATPRECQDLLADDPDLADCLTRLDVSEPDPEVATKLLHRLAGGLAARYGVEIGDDAVRQAVLLTASYVLNDQLPSKALKVLHRACDDLDYERGHKGGTRGRVGADDVVRVVAERTGVPEGTLRGIADGPDFEGGLRRSVLGQDHAVREVATELGLIRAGMTDPGKPASVMLFLGLTGTGKTELAKALARLYSASGRLRTYALGNCVEPHSVSTIIGVPPGYVGHDRGGPLVNELNADPYGVFLLDEADKAHPDVLQPFLNLFDEGWVADQRGVRAYGDRAVFILTTNVGQRMIAELAEQGKSPDEIRERMKEILPQIRHGKADRPVFTPEFLARLRRVVVFAPLGAEAMGGIARKQLGELRQTWAARRGKGLAVPEELAAHVAAEAQRLNERSKGKEGGRVVRKLIADRVEAPLQRAISARPADYRACGAVRLELVPPAGGAPGDPVPAPEVRVHFERGAPAGEPGPGNSPARAGEPRPVPAGG